MPLVGSHQLPGITQLHEHLNLWSKLTTLTVTVRYKVVNQELKQFYEVVMMVV